MPDEAPHDFLSGMLGWHSVPEPDPTTTTTTPDPNDESPVSGDFLEPMLGWPAADPTTTTTTTTTPEPPLVYIDSHNTGQVILGVSGQFKVNPSAVAVKRNRKNGVIQLGLSKPKLVTVLAFFDAVINGTRFDSEEFIYQDPSKTLTIQSITGIPGVVEDTGPDAGYAIPITYLPNTDRVICTNIYPEPTRLD